MAVQSVVSKKRNEIISLCLAAIEDCLNGIIKKNIIPKLSSVTELLDEVERKRLEGFEEKYDDFDQIVLNEKTLKSKVELISKNISDLETKEQLVWKQFQSEFLIIFSIRNSYAHNRELHPEDQEAVINFCSQLSKRSRYFYPLKDTLKNIDSTGFLLNEDDSEVLINFPNPDYVAHQFVGREELFEKIITELTETKWRVISLVGQGGIGKSAFVDHVCRYLAQEEFYSKIIWFSDKREFFDLNKSTSEIITDKQTLKEFENDPLGDQSISLDELLSQDSEYLIIFDNLETILDEGVEFIERNAGKAQFLVTSRVQVELGRPYKMKPLDAKDSLKLIKNMNSYLNIDELENLNDDQIIEIGSDFENSPLFIKWGLHQMQKGLTLISIKNRQTKVSEFCFSGLLSAISENARYCLNILNIMTGRVTLLKLQLFTGKNHDDLNDAMSELQKFSLVRRGSKNTVRFFYINESIKPLLKDTNLEDLYETKKLEKEIENMTRVISVLRGKQESEEQVFFDQESFIVNDENDLLILWKISEITRTVKKGLFKDNKISLLEYQNNELRELGFAYPNDPQLLIQTGIAFSYSDKKSEAINAFEKAYNLANTKFVKKKALYFLCTALDGIRDYYEMNKYAEKLYSIDQSFHSLSQLSSSLIGLKNYDKAFSYLELNMIQLIEEMESSDHKIRSIMINLKTVSNLLLKGDVDHDLFERSFIFLKNLSVSFLGVLDKSALINLKKTISTWNDEYKRYLSRNLMDPKLDAEYLVEELKIEASKIPDKGPLYKFIDSWSIRGNTFQNPNEEFSFESDDLKNETILDAYNNKTSFEGEIVSVQVNRKSGKTAGYIVSVDNASCFLPIKLANEDIKIGYKGSFYPIEKGRENFIVGLYSDGSHKNKNFNEITDDYTFNKLNEGDIYSGKVIKISTDFANVALDVGSNIRGAISRKELNKIEKYKSVEDLNEVFNLYSIYDFKIVGFNKERKYLYLLP